MIHLPERAVTRFFVPLIDVLILLFCIFLLLPFVSGPDGKSTDGPPVDVPALQRKLKEAEDQLKIREEEVRRLMDERAKIADRTAVRVLEIDPTSGDLFYLSEDGPETKPVKVTSEAQAKRLIERTRQKAGDKQAYFLILYPRTRSAYPTQPQLERYADWFRDVPHKFDNPFAR